jgi:hypothetical protein
VHHITEPYLVLLLKKMGTNAAEEEGEEAELEDRFLEMASCG